MAVSFNLLSIDHAGKLELMPAQARDEMLSIYKGLP